MPFDISAYTTRQWGMITAEQALTCGFTYSEIKQRCARGTWTRLRVGIYLPAPLPAPTGRTAEEVAAERRARHLLDVAAALVATGAEPAAVAGVSAAILWNLPWVVPAPLDEVTLVRRGGKPRRYPGLRVRPAALPAGHVVPASNGMRVTSAARTLVDLARRLPLHVILPMADHALRQRLTTRAELQRVLSACRRFPGIAAAARKLAHADARSGSPAESYARARLIEAGFTGYDLQVVVADTRGVIVARLDIAFAELHVAVETDGRLKYATPDDLWREKIREDKVRALGWEFVRLTWSDLEAGPEAVRAKIQPAYDRALRRAA